MFEERESSVKYICLIKQHGIKNLTLARIFLNLTENDMSLGQKMIPMIVNTAKACSHQKIYGKSIQESILQIH